MTRAFLDEDDAERWRTGSDQLCLRRAFVEENKRLLRIEELMEEQERLGWRRLELLEASTVVGSKRHSKVGTRLTWARDIQMGAPDST